MVFGDSCLFLKHVKSVIKIHFNAFDALTGWKQEALPPVEAPVAAKWKFRSKSFQQVILDYDYTFTTPYCGSQSLGIEKEKHGRRAKEKDPERREKKKKKEDLGGKVTRCLVLLGIFFNSYLIFLFVCHWYVFSLFLEFLIFIFGILKIVPSFFLY